VSKGCSRSVQIAPAEPDKERTEMTPFELNVLAYEQRLPELLANAEGNNQEVLA
jgi:hypothetical protein